MADTPHWVRISTQVDQDTAERVRQMAAKSSPRRSKSEMLRHLIRLGLRTYDDPPARFPLAPDPRSTDRVA